MLMYSNLFMDGPLDNCTMSQWLRNVVLN